MTRARSWIVGVILLSACSKAPEAPDVASPATTSAPPTAAPTTATPADVTSAATDAAPAAKRYLLGRMELPSGLPLKLLVTFTSPSEATLDIPLQGLREGQLVDVALGDDVVRFTFRPPGAPPDGGNRFEARRVPDEADAAGKPARWAGEVKDSGIAIPITFTEVAGPEALVASRPQTPKPPWPYQTEDVRVKVDGAELGCTLILPKPTKPLPAVLLLTGSGVQDRDETLFEHKPFLVLADALARTGIASLRCDDRGAGQSSGDPQVVDAQILASDARAALAWMKGRIELDARALGVIGHSEGGMTAAALARQPDSGVAFIVTLAGPMVSGRHLLVRQNRDLLVSQGVKASAREALEQAIEAYFLTIEEDRGDEAIKAAARKLAELADAETDPAATKQPVEAVAANFEALAKSPWLRGFVRSRPAEDVAAARVPALVLFGSKDVQVDAVENKAALEESLQKTGKADVTLVVVEGANHLFQSATTGAIAEYDTIEETMAPATVKQVVEWVAKLTGTKEP